MKGGWVVGDFYPATLQCKEAEFGIKHYKAGESNEMHYHKIGTEVTVIISGFCFMNKVLLSEGRIAVVKPGEASDFTAQTDCIVAVFKTPSVKGDKYEGYPS